MILVSCAKCLGRGIVNEPEYREITYLTTAGEVTDKRFVGYTTGVCPACNGEGKRFDLWERC